MLRRNNCHKSRSEITRVMVKAIVHSVGTQEPGWARQLIFIFVAIWKWNKSCIQQKCRSGLQGDLCMYGPKSTYVPGASMTWWFNCICLMIQSLYFEKNIRIHYQWLINSRELPRILPQTIKPLTLSGEVGQQPCVSWWKVGLFGCEA